MCSNILCVNSGASQLSDAGGRFNSSARRAHSKLFDSHDSAIRRLEYPCIAGSKLKPNSSGRQERDNFGRGTPNNREIAASETSCDAAKLICESSAYAGDSTAARVPIQRRANP